MRQIFAVVTLAGLAYAQGSKAVKPGNSQPSIGESPAALSSVGNPDLLGQLPPAPAGTIMVAIDGKIVRLAKATREILDVFDVR